MQYGPVRETKQSGPQASVDFAISTFLHSE